MRSAMQYRLNVAVMTLAGIAYQGSGFAFIWVVLERFPSLAGWSFAQVAFLYGLRLVAHAAYLLPFNMLTALDGVVRDGDFDRYLLRPLNPLVQLMTTRGMRPGAFGDLVAGASILAVAGTTAGIDWTFGAVVLTLCAIAGGALIEAAVQLALGALSFRLLSTFEIRVFMDDVFGRFGSYPMKIFGGGTEWVLTFVLPVALLAYVPAAVLLDQGVDSLRVAPVIAYLTPLIGVLMMSLAYLFWSRQLRHYQSAGH